MLEHAMITSQSFVFVVCEFVANLFADSMTVLLTLPADFQRCLLAGADAGTAEGKLRNRRLVSAGPVRGLRRVEQLEASQEGLADGLAIALAWFRSLQVQVLQVQVLQGDYAVQTKGGMVSSGAKAAAGFDADSKSRPEGAGRVPGLPLNLKLRSVTSIGI
jgi:hypothetical protein